MSFSATVVRACLLTSLLLTPQSHLPGEDSISRLKPTRVLASDAGEGPAWHPRSGLYFSGRRGITRLGLNGEMQPFRYPSGGSNGLLFDQQGRLVVCEAGRRLVTRTELDGSRTVLAAEFEDKRFNTPNDLTIDSKGRIYFSDPRYGDRRDMELKDADGRIVEGVYRIDAPGQVTRVITHEVDRPNGLLITPDDRYLFVADNNNNQVEAARTLFRFELTPAGEVDLASKKTIFDWGSGRGPDGMAMDPLGRLWVAGGRNRPSPPFETAGKFEGGIYVMSQDGELLGFIRIPKDEVTNCVFAGPDRKTLYITAGGELWKVQL